MNYKPVSLRFDAAHPSQGAFSNIVGRQWIARQQVYRSSYERALQQAPLLHLKRENRLGLGI